MSIIAREVEFSPGEAPQTYHAVSQQDYLAILALTPDGRIPIVRQFRPALEAFTWELPAGLLEPGEDAGAGCPGGRVRRHARHLRGARVRGPRTPASRGRRG